MRGRWGRGKVRGEVRGGGGCSNEFTKNQLGLDSRYCWLCPVFWLCVYACSTIAAALDSRHQCKVAWIDNDCAAYKNARNREAKTQQKCT